MTASPEMAAPALTPVRLLPRVAVLLNLLFSEQVGRRLDRAGQIVVLRRPVGNRPVQQRQKLPPVHSKTRNHCTPPQLD
jgi:hypothetical protein